ncbi:MAG: DUF2934 domain-containing protein [Planctomycetota bacterium]
MNVTTTPTAPKPKPRKPKPRKPITRNTKPQAGQAAKPARSVKAAPLPQAPVEVTAPAAAPVVTDEQISKRAYEIWLEKGRPYGQEQANWEQAVAELRG